MSERNALATAPSHCRELESESANKLQLHRVELLHIADIQEKGRPRVPIYATPLFEPCFRLPADDGGSVEIEARETFIILRLMRIRFPRSARLMAHDFADSLRTGNFDYSVFDRYGEIDVG